MKHTVKQLHPYTNFNASDKTRVVTFGSNGTYPGAICTYHAAHNCSFYLSSAMFTYVIKGCKYMLIDKQEYYLQPGDLLYLPKNTVAFTDIPQTNGPFESFNMVLPDHLLSNFPGLKQFHATGLSHSSFMVRRRDTVTAAVDAFLKNAALTEHQHSTATYTNLVMHLLSACKHQLFKNDTNNITERADVQAIAGMLTENIYKPLSVTKMAALCGMSLPTFKRKFTRLFGEAPKTWIRNIRLQAAYFHLKTNHEPVSDVSTFVGFDNFAHFSYAFKKYFQIRPSALLEH